MPSKIVSEKDVADAIVNLTIHPKDAMKVYGTHYFLQAFSSSTFSKTDHTTKDGLTNMDDTLADRNAIKELIQNWVIWRDTGDWERFRTIWHPDGVMTATWRQGTVEEFISASQEGWKNGVRIFHLLGGSSVDVSGDRAISQTKVVITQRAALHGTVCDVNCMARHYDFWEKRSGTWGLVLRESIYDKDRLDPITPGVTVPLDSSLLEQFPEGYRHLAYLQTSIGYTVKKGMPCTTGAALDELYARGATWLRGDA